MQQSLNKETSIEEQLITYCYWTMVFLNDRCKLTWKIIPAASASYFAPCSADVGLLVIKIAAHIQKRQWFGLQPQLPLCFNHQT